MKNNEISRVTGSTTGNQVATRATIARRFAEELTRSYMKCQAVPAIYDPEREFRLFTKVVLEPLTVVAVEPDLVIPATDSEQTGLEVQGLATFVSYKANLGDVVGKCWGSRAFFLLSPPLSYTCVYTRTRWHIRGCR